MRWIPGKLCVGMMLLTLGCVGENNASSDEGLMEAAGGNAGTVEDAGGGGGSGGDESQGAGGEFSGADGGDAAGGAGGNAGAVGAGGAGGSPEVMPAPRPPTHLGGDRPATYFLPRDYGAEEPMALVLSLHGYTLNASHQNAYFTLSENLRDRNALLITPNGRFDSNGNRFWAATDLCCDGLGIGESDVQYLRGLIEEAIRYFPIDPQRIGVVGYSNGGFMAHRLACDASDLVTSIVSLAGTSWAQLERCAPTHPVSVLQVHGTWDTIVRYEGQARTDGEPGAPFDILGCRARECSEPAERCRSDAGCLTLWECVNDCGWGAGTEDCRQICYLQAGLDSRFVWMDDFVCTLNRGCYDNPAQASVGYAGSEDMVGHWRQRNGCDEEPAETMPLDLSLSYPGADTTATQWAGCDEGTEVDLWRINRENHGPSFTPLFRALVAEWLVSTPRDESND